MIENQRAAGVEIEAHKQIQIVRARREGDPRRLVDQLAQALDALGIGPAEQLKAHGDGVVADRPGVGQNLQDHMELYIQQESRRPITLNGVLNPFSKGLIGRAGC